MAYSSNTACLKKKKSTRAHRLTAPLSAPIAAVRGFIPASVQPTDSPYEIADIYRVCVGTARIWLRILRGPKFNY